MSETGQVLQTTGGTEKIDVFYNPPPFSLPFSIFIVHACHSHASFLISFTSEDDLFWLLIQPPGVHFWSQFLLHPSCHFLQVYKPALFAPMLKTSHNILRISWSLKEVALHRSAFVLSAIFPHLCSGSLEVINDLKWDLPSTAPTSCNTAFALVLSGVGSSIVHPSQVFPGT